MENNSNNSNDLNKAKQVPEEKPKLFLILAGIMLLTALLSYIFEEELYDINHSVQLFVLLITGSLAFALFFLTCYRVPSLGRKFLGQESGLDAAKKTTSMAVFNPFKSENPVEEKIQASARKKTRHTRKSFKNQKVSVGRLPSDNDGVGNSS